jgi:hypothetical protein
MIGAGQVRQIASAWVDWIAAGLGKLAKDGLEFLVEEGQVNNATKECRLCGSTGPHQTIVREMMFGTGSRLDITAVLRAMRYRLLNVPEGEELTRLYPPDY